ncbi:MAG: 16S rRNA (guanine(966)-N(2))-methyltransferase RsmD [Cellvibrionaceae bacterium]
MKSAAKPSTRNQLRIIGGKWRGRKLDFPSIDGLRPTGDRVRETLFNWLAPYIVESRCLDLFSGSGALGFEAVSRGAASALLIDANKQVTKQLEKNCEKLDAANIQIACHEAISWLKNSKQPVAFKQQSTHLQHSNPLQSNHPSFDIIFLDPPFEKHLFDEVISLLDHSSALSSQSLIYLETPREYQFSTPKHWLQLKEKHAGQVSFYLYEYSKQADSDPIITD